MERTAQEILKAVWVDFTDESKLRSINTFAKDNGLTKYETEQLLTLAALVADRRQPEE